MNQMELNQMELNQMNHSWQTQAAEYLSDSAQMQAGTQEENGPGVELALQNLIQAVWESPEYRRYQHIRAKVHELPQLEADIHAFRKKNYQTQNFADEHALFDQVDELEREGAQFRKNPLVNEYLDAELGICRLFQKINWELVLNIDFDLGFDAGQ